MIEVASCQPSDHFNQPQIKSKQGTPSIQLHDKRMIARNLRISKGNVNKQRMKCAMSNANSSAVSTVKALR